MKRSPIIQKYVDGEINDDDIDDMIEKWHKGEADFGIPLHEYLGFTKEDYTKWVINQSWLSELRRKNGKQKRNRN